MLRDRTKTRGGDGGCTSALGNELPAREAASSKGTPTWKNTTRSQAFDSFQNWVSLIFLPFCIHSPTMYSCVQVCEESPVLWATGMSERPQRNNEPEHLGPEEMEWGQEGLKTRSGQTGRLWGTQG